MKHLNLKRILEQVGETKEEFAKEIDISVQELEAYENGSMSPCLELLDVIAEHTDLKHKDIMVDDSVAKKTAEKKKANPRIWE